MNMKKLSVILITALLLLSCSCGDVRFEPDKYPDAGFLIDTGNFEIRGNVKVSSYEDITFTFTYPEGLSYLTLNVSPAGYFADVGGVKDEIDPDALPDNAPVKLFAESLKAFLYEKNEFRRDDGGGYLTEREILGETVSATFTAEGEIDVISCGDTVIRILHAVG